MNKKGYIDPGTGGMVIGLVWPVILVIPELGRFVLEKDEDIAVCEIVTLK